MTAPSSPSTTSDLEAARHLIGLGEGFGTGRAARRLAGRAGDGAPAVGRRRGSPSHGVVHGSGDRQSRPSSGRCMRHSRGCMPVRVRPTNPSAPGGRPVTSSRASGSAYRIPDSVRASQFSSDRHSPDDASLGWTGLMFASRGRQAKTSITDEDLGTTRLALGMTGRRPPRLHPGITQEVAPNERQRAPKART